MHGLAGRLHPATPGILPKTTWYSQASADTSAGPVAAEEEGKPNSSLAPFFASPSLTAIFRASTTNPPDFAYFADEDLEKDASESHATVFWTVARDATRPPQPRAWLLGSVQRSIAHPKKSKGRDAIAAPPSFYREGRLPQLALRRCPHCAPATVKAPKRAKIIPPDLTASPGQPIDRSDAEIIGRLTRSWTTVGVGDHALAVTPSPALAAMHSLALTVAWVRRHSARAPVVIKAMGAVGLLKTHQRLRAVAP